MNKLKSKLIIAVIVILGVTIFMSCEKEGKYEEIKVKEESVSKKLEIIDYSDKIPDKLTITRSDLPNLISASEYSDRLGGYIVVDGIVNENNEARLLSVKVIKIKSPSASQSIKTRSSSDCGDSKSYRGCARCCTNKPTSIGVVLCTGYCVVEAIERRL